MATTRKGGYYIGINGEPHDAFGNAVEAEPEGYAAQTKAELAAEAEERGLTIEGTGADGNVLKDDLIAALEADDG